jgi:hypothetical protein
MEDIEGWVGLVPFRYPYGMLRGASRPIPDPFSSLILQFLESQFLIAKGKVSIKKRLVQALGKTAKR